MHSLHSAAGFVVPTRCSATTDWASQPLTLPQFGTFSPFCAVIDDVNNFFTIDNDGREKAEQGGLRARG